MAKSRVMQLTKNTNIKAVRRLSPSKRLEIAAELSDLCIELTKSGEKARPHGTDRKS